MTDNGDVCCAECEHYSPEGCEEAAEALALEGWPRVVVRPDDDADASRCPEFSPGASLALDLDDEQSARDQRLRADALRGCGIW